MPHGVSDPPPQVQVTSFNKHSPGGPCFPRDSVEESPTSPGWPPSAAAKHREQPRLVDVLCTERWAGPGPANAPARTRVRALGWPRRTCRLLASQADGSCASSHARRPPWSRQAPVGQTSGLLSDWVSLPEALVSPFSLPDF